MNAQKYVAVALTGALAFAPLVGCGAQQATDEGNAKTTEEAAPTEQLAGGWAVSSDTYPSLSEEEREVFQKAVADYEGEDLEPVTVLATQVVAGRNYAFLCKGTTVTADPVTTWDIVVVYRDLEDNATITSVKAIELGDVKVAKADDQDQNVVGGWEVRNPSDSIALSSEASEAFGKASQNYDGVVLTPMALLGTQVVAGTNYMVLCQGTPVTQNPQQKLYVATVYQDLEGNAEFTDVAQFDLLAYVSE